MSLLVYLWTIFVNFLALSGILLEMCIFPDYVKKPFYVALAHKLHWYVFFTAFS